MQVHYTVEYKILGFLSPVPGSKWKAGQTVPLKIALADANGVRIADTQAAALTATPCRVTFTATGAQPRTATCLKYDPATDQFLYTWALAKTPTGTAALTVTVTYPGTTTVSTKPEQITITR